MFGESWGSGYDPGTKQQSSVDELTALKPRVQTNAFDFYNIQCCGPWDYPLGLDCLSNLLLQHPKVSEGKDSWTQITDV